MSKHSRPARRPIHAWSVALALIWIPFLEAAVSSPTNEPLTQVQVLALIAGGVSEQRVAMLIQERGIAFEPTADRLEKLKECGAHGRLLEALSKARVVEMTLADVRAQTRTIEHLLAGVQLARKGLYEGAEEQYRAAQQLNPASAELHFCLAYIFREQSRWKDAEQEYRLAIQLKPDFPEAHTGIGSALAMKGDLEGAIAELREALRLTPDDERAHGLLGALLTSKRDLDGAIQELRLALRLDPSDAQAHANLGLALASKGDLDEAIREFRESVRLKPDFALAHNNFGNVLRGKGDLEKAAAEYRTAIHLEPNLAMAHSNLADLLQIQGKYAEAERFYQQALALTERALGPEHPQVASLLGSYAVLLRKMNRGAEAARIEARAKAIRAKHGPDGSNN